MNTFHLSGANSLPPTKKMGEASKIMRSSIHAFLQSYHSFTTIAILLVFPVSTSILLSHAFIPSSSLTLRAISSRLHSLFEAAGFPATSHFFSLLNLKISQTIFSFIFTLSFSLTFLILAKVSIVQTIQGLPWRWQASPPPFSSLLHLCPSVLLTHIFNSFVILSANAAVFSLLFLAFNTMDVLGLSSSNSILALSAAGAVLYSIVLANTLVTCNLAIIVSAIDNCSGYLAVLKACILIRGKVATALTLALPTNLGMAALEALFHYRVVKPYYLLNRFNSSIVWEGLTITYMYSILMVLDIIMSCMFVKSCNLGCQSNWEHGCNYPRELEPEEKAALQV